MMMMKSIRQFFHDQSASSAAEFALVLPVVLILIFGAITSGVMMYTVVKLQHATETSARCLSADGRKTAGVPECSVDNIAPFAQIYYTGPALSGLGFSAAKQACGYKVTATGTFNFFAGFGILSIPLQTSACYPGPDAPSP